MLSSLLCDNRAQILFKLFGDFQRELRGGGEVMVGKENS
jgi:hypothetical protein